MMRIIFSGYGWVFICLLLAAGVTGCGPHGRVIVEGDRGRVIVDIPQTYEEPYPDGNYYPAKGRYESRLPIIPPGHMPPPGKCRIWYPDRTPGDQPPPGDCHELQYQVPPGAWLIHG